MIDGITLRSGLMETVKHACLTDAKMNPGSIYRYINQDIYKTRTPFAKDQKLDKFRIGFEDEIRVDENAPFKRAIEARKKGVKVGTFSEISAGNFIKKFLQSNELKQLVIDKNTTVKKIS